jgi:hypothetical protein
MTESRRGARKSRRSMLREFLGFLYFGWVDSDAERTTKREITNRFHR